MLIPRDRRSLWRSRPLNRRTPRYVVVATTEAARSRGPEPVNQLIFNSLAIGRRRAFIVGLRRSMSTPQIHVLVVEDDEVCAQAARTMLERMGCRVDTASN